ncbi:YdeI family protein [Rhizobium sp. OAE497]|uniref:YdeI/OmpD-associated family protein n=1 Tax=Rhizobium sp. OAE497 TaxID=2663796 RepID=UPI0018F37241
MPQTVTNPKVDAYFSRRDSWQEEFTRLRRILLDTGLSEDLKWGEPCYTLDGANIVLIHGFKDYCALLFFKGALMTDTAGALIQQTKNVQAARQIRFTNADEISGMENVLKAYVAEAAEIERSGAKIDFKGTDEFAVPEEFQAKIDSTPSLKTAFEALTPGRQRAYLLHFAQPKQAKTRESRIEKAMPQILAGKGLND